MRLVVKQKRGRRRYVIFSCAQPYRDRDEAVDEVNRVFRSHGTRSPHVIDVGPWHLIVRCSPQERDGVLEIMASLERGLTPLRTSGTLRTLRDRYRLER